MNVKHVQWSILRHLPWASELFPWGRNVFQYAGKAKACSVPTFWPYPSYNSATNHEQTLWMTMHAEILQAIFFYLLVKSRNNCFCDTCRLHFARQKLSCFIYLVHTGLNKKIPWLSTNKTDELLLHDKIREHIFLIGSLTNRVRSNEHFHAT